MKVPRINSLICAVLEGILSDVFFGELILEEIIILEEQLIFNIEAENLMLQ